MALSPEEKLKIEEMLADLHRPSKEQNEISSNINKWRKRYDEYKKIKSEKDIFLWLKKEKNRLIEDLDEIDVDSIKFVYSIRIINLIKLKIEENITLLEDHEIEVTSEKKLFNLLRLDQIDKVLKELLTIVKDKQRSDLIKDITLQGNRWTTLKKNSQNNLVSIQDENIEKNKIVVALFELISTLSD